MSKPNFVRGSVSMIACGTCQARIPRFDFETETDVGDVGLCSAARCNHLDLVIAETTLAEWNALNDGTLRTLPKRLAGDVVGDDYHVLQVKRIDQAQRPAAGGSFAEFRKQYVPPRVVYECPCCEVGEAVVVEEFTVPEFEAIGGRIIPLGSVALRP
jgi:hypothetical protein